MEKPPRQLNAAWERAPNGRRRLPRPPRAADIAYAVLLLLYLAPLWLVRYVPTCDGPSHLANALIVKRLLAGEGGAVGRYYALNRAPAPNLAYEGLVVAALQIMPPLTAEKAVLTLVVLTFALGFRRLGAAVGGRAGPAAFLFLPFALSLPFHMGFFSFMMSLGMAAFALAHLWRRRADVDGRWVIAAAAAAAAVFVAHLMGWAFFVGGLLLSAAAAAALQPPRKKYLYMGVALAAAVAPGIWYVAVAPREAAVRWPAARVARYLVAGDVLRGFNRWQDVVALAVVVAVAAAIVWAVAARLRRRRPLQAADWWLAGAIAAAALCFAVPEWGPAGGGWIVRRGALIPLILVSVWLAAAEGWLRRALGVVAPALALAYLGALAIGYHDADQELREFNSGRCVVAAGSTVVPLIYKYPSNDRNVTSCLRTGGSYYTLDRDAVDLLNYEPGMAYFPVTWRAGYAPAAIKRFSVGTPVVAVAGGYGRVDYIVCWRINPFLGELQTTFRDYYCVHATRRLMVLKRKAGR